MVIDVRLSYPIHADNMLTYELQSRLSGNVLAIQRTIGIGHRRNI